MLSLINLAWLKPSVRRIKLSLVSGLDVDFVDRDVAIQQVIKWAGKGTGFPIVVFGPEGCGKTSWLLQSVEVLRETGFDVIYFNPMRRRFEVEVGIESLRQHALDILKQAASEYALAKLAWSVIDLAIEAIRHGRGRLAVIVDDAFQYLDKREAALIIKGMLELIEHPPEHYEKIVILIATSEGLSRSEIGHHRWAHIMPMWNMPREGFQQLYEKVPGPKPPFNEVWKWAGGNPNVLRELYMAGWSRDAVVAQLIREKRLTPGFIARWRVWLEKVVNDPEALWSPDVPEELIRQLVERNLIVYNIYEREQIFWIDQPPPERDPELGIGKDVAWQTPIHREVVKQALKETK
jgi:KaiC/GvpD/RAD55 family RecA-like ATPase